MTWLTPWAAWAFVLAAPIIALYLVRPAERRRAVSTLLFWQKAVPQEARVPWWRRFRQWWSLLLQLLLLLLLLLAGMQPVVGLSSGGGTTPSAVPVVVLDNSPSTAVGEAWAKLREQAETLIGQRGEQGLAVVVTSPTARVLLPATAPRAQALRLLRAAEPAATAGELAPALALARSIAGPSGAVQLLVDGFLPASEWPSPPVDQTVARWSPTVAEGSNVGVVRLAARRPAATPGIVEVELEVAGNPAWEAAAELTIERDGAIFDVRPVRPDENRRWRYRWEVPSQAAELWTATLRPAGADLLLADNRAQLAIPPVSLVGVQLAPEASPFLSAVVASLTGISASLAGPTVWRIAEGSPIGAGTTDIRGPALWLDPGDGPWGNLDADRPMEAAVAALPVDIAVAPWLRGVDLTAVQWRQVRRYRPAPEAVVYALAVAPDGSELPLIWGRWPQSGGGPPWLATAFGIGASDLPLRTAFPIWMGNLAESLRAGRADAQAVVPGLAETTLPTPSTPPPQAVVTLPGQAWAGWPWLLALALLWCLWEWRSFHRRWSE